MNARLLNKAFLVSPELSVMLRYFLKTDEWSCYGLIDLFRSFDLMVLCLFQGVPAFGERGALKQKLNSLLKECERRPHEFHRWEKPMLDDDGARVQRSDVRQALLDELTWLCNTAAAQDGVNHLLDDKEKWFTRRRVTAAAIGRLVYVYRYPSRQL